MNDGPHDHDLPLPPLYGIAASGPNGEVTLASLDLHGSAADASKAVNVMQRVPGAAYLVVTVMPAEMDAWDVPDEDEDPAGGASNGE